MPRARRRNHPDGGGKGPAAVAPDFRPPAGHALIALTGGLACGKSEVGRIWAEAGVPVLDADGVAHACLRKGTAVHRMVVRHFGRDVLGEDGELDRARLGERVFARPVERRALEAIVHPAVFRACRRWSRKVLRTAPVAAIQIPLLFETGATRGWTAIVCVTAPRAVVLKRLAGRGCSPAQARRRLAAQWPVSEKARRSEYVIHNQGSLVELKKQALDVLSRAAP